MKVFITGLSGFIGGHLAYDLVEAGHDVAGLMRQASGASRLDRGIFRDLAGRMTFYYGSLLDFYTLRQILADFRPEAICHLGAITPVAYSFDHPHEVVATNFNGTVHLLEAARETLPDLQRFIFAGTAEEYGNQETFPIPETAELRAMCPYAAAKIGAEKYARYMWDVYKLPVVCFRQANTYGRRDNDYFLVETIVTQMLRRRDTISLGDPRPLRDLLHINDLTAAYKLALTDERLLGEVVNVSTATSISVADLVHKISAMLDWSGEVRWHTRPQRPGEVWNLTLDNAKIKRLVKWTPAIDLTTGLHRTIAHWQDVVQSAR